MVALAKAYQDTDSSHSRTSRLRIINKLRRSDCFWRKAALEVCMLDLIKFRWLDLAQTSP
jgi:hypothetical protein